MPAGYECQLPGHPDHERIVVRVYGRGDGCPGYDLLAFLASLATGSARRDSMNVRSRPVAILEFIDVSWKTVCWLMPPRAISMGDRRRDRVNSPRDVP